LRRLTRFAVAITTAALTVTLGNSTSAWALDKQGSAHGGQLAGEDSGFGVSGSSLVGVALYNPTYAARPDNTGRVLMRFAQHFDIDLIGERLDIPIDLNLFTDRQQSGANRFRPSEFDVITGLASTWPVSNALAFEIGVRGERDMPIDRKGLVQQYVDTRLRLIYSMNHAWPKLSDTLGGGDIAGAWTLGWFSVNPTYAARPDNTGVALFRYGHYFEVSALNRHIGLGCSTTLFTDRRSSWLRPSELDLVPEVITRLGRFEFHVAYERDMPLDRSGLVQSLVLAHLQWNFNLTDEAPETEEVKRIHENDGVEKGGGSH
jgi:hypothetical protein